MKTYKWLTPNVWRAGLMGFVLAASGPAMAATYNILLKEPGSTTPVDCARGAFNFTKGEAGTGSATATVTVDANCLVQVGTYTGTVSVIVEDVTLDGQAQGPNVVGLSGTLPRVGGGNSSALGFAYTAGSASSGQPIRTLTLTTASGSTASSTYHLFNAANPVPEPESLALVVVGLGALALSGHILRRRKSPT